jgi:hypothetical protein
LTAGVDGESRFRAAQIPDCDNTITLNTDVRAAPRAVGAINHITVF